MPRASAGVRSARLRKYSPNAKTLFGHMHVPEVLRDELNFLSIITTREAFSALIANHHPPESEAHRLVLKAYDTAERELGDRRRHSGEREFRHAFRCSLLLWIYCGVRDEHRISAMYGHDLPETFRHKWTTERVRKEFGERTAVHVDFMTKIPQRKGLSKREVERKFYQRLAEAPAEDVENKGVDVLDNLLTLWKRSLRRMWRKIDDVVRFLLPLLRKHNLEKLRRAILLVLWEIRRKLHNNLAFAH